MSVQLKSPSVALEGRWADSCSPLCPLLMDCHPLTLLAADHSGWWCKRAPLARPVLTWQPVDTCDLPGQQRVVKPSETLPEGLAISALTSGGGQL